MIARKDIYWGDTVLKRSDEPVSGGIVEIRGEKFYRIEHYDRIPPFRMSVVSSSDHWMFVSSKGGLSCGRKNPNSALFPYETDDKLHDSVSHTGPRTSLLVEKAGKTHLWNPFSEEMAVYATQRNLYKSLVGNRLVFEEVNHDLGLIFSYCWSTSLRFGFVKTSRVHHTGTDKVSVEILDGIRNMLPPGVSREMQSATSTLVDAYKKAEVDRATGAGIYSLSSIPTDRAEPSESLRATVAWCLGIDKPVTLLSERQSAAFCAGLPLSSEPVMKGLRGAYFLKTGFTLLPGEQKNWYLISDIGLGPSDVLQLLDDIARGIDAQDVEADIDAGTRRLVQLVGGADGCQLTSDERISGRHFTNTLFNIMRGGTFPDVYRIRHDDFLAFVARWNAPLCDSFAGLLAGQPDPLDRKALLSAVESTGDANLHRLALEYLPLTFSRRHGDPSRPWNEFNIEPQDPEGRDRLYYQGNWRDIFQNWEALALSYPEFINSFIAKFVNASTVDGFNAYRISSDGIDWEELDPNDAWSNIGYWGDHQANYLTGLLDFSYRYFPGQVVGLLGQDLFVYADVPYRIKPYQALLDDPRNSIEFDRERALQAARRVSKLGADGKLVTLSNGSIYRVNLLEKLLVSALCKLGSFVPGGGIWMNTQRPEWNDANNALAGFGLSIVTLGYLRRLLNSLKRFVGEAAPGAFPVSSEVVHFFREIDRTLSGSLRAIDETLTDKGRKDFMDRVGAIASGYRERVYAGFTGERSALNSDQLLVFFDTALAHLDFTLGLSRRPDGFFDSYNTIRFGDSGFAVRRLPEMLEGQVALLGSGYLDAQGSLALLDVLRDSRLYCPARRSYLLYPDEEPAPFLERNLIPKSLVDATPWILAELASGRRGIIEQDIHGNAHFNGSFRNVADLHSALDEAGRSGEVERTKWRELYESVFHHKEFTGRSSTMFKYEGLGSIYWHMVSKLLLAVSLVVDEARRAGVDKSTLERLRIHFDEIKAGLGLHKSPAEYGAIPLDPYSHTPGFTGPQQPGMTGQVKEDVITRFLELGISVRGGIVSFDPYLVKRGEFLQEDRSWQFSCGKEGPADLIEAGSMAFSLCATPVIYQLGGAVGVRVFTADNPAGEDFPGLCLSESLSLSLFRRDNRIRKIVVTCSEALVN
ncbi:MAG: hypothetical protein V2I48_00935 [Xanthomonadales bacterium]|nr:hypothetical protein [Xanthomonadales bacterium]